jgi:ferric-dicitrate binding protein FerR (iron transport regulator)
MKEQDFKILLRTAAKGKASHDEYKNLEKLVDKRLRNAGDNIANVHKSRKIIFDNVMTNIKLRHKFLRSSYLKYAAGIAILIISGVLLFKNNLKVAVRNEEIVFLEATAKPGEPITVMLPDSSKVVLNSGAWIKYPNKFFQNKRTVELKGEAFFKVQRDPSRPFTVCTEEISTTVLGTTFNVSENFGNVTVTVSTGKVMVRKQGGKGQVYLLPNQQVAYTRETGNFLKQRVNAISVSDWSRNVFNLEYLTLEQAISRIGDWYKVLIKCNSTNLLKRTIKGKYKNKSLAYILDDIAFMLDAKYQYINDSTIIIHE